MESTINTNGTIPKGQPFGTFFLKKIENSTIHKGSKKGDSIAASTNRMYNRASMPV